MSILHPRRARRAVVAGLSLALASSAASVATLALPTAAHAADRTPFYVVGTSDVSDSGLVSKVLEPRFEALYPQYDLLYTAKGTGAALTDARNGLAAATIVHAASAENSFVGDGFSLEQYGRLVFWGDYVLLGPKSDPAGVASAAPNDIVGAFEKVAAAGAAGQASFVTRGGTPGTAIQEHAIWALTTGVSTCTVGTGSQGGGKRPKAATEASTTCGATSPDAQGASGGADWPGWYGSGSSTSQAANINIANTCPSAASGGASAFPNGNCYVFTDRGTYKNLVAQGLAQNLKIVTRDNSPTARGGRDALINVFHAYAVNPAKFANPSSTKVDTTAAKLFLDFLTSASTQEEIGDYLAADGDQAFVPAASPVTTYELKKDEVTLGKKSTIKGNIANAVPGYPVLSGVPVNLLQANSDSAVAVPKVVATATTNAAGDFRIKRKLKAGKTYRIGVPQIAKVEIATLNPPFGSILTAASTPAGTVSGFRLKPVKLLGKGRFVLPGKLKADSDGKGKVTVYAAQRGELKRVGTVKVKDGRSRFAFRGRLAPGTWKLQLGFDDTGGTLPTLSKVTTLRIRA